MPYAPKWEKQEESEREREIVQYINMTFRKADDSLVCSEKT
jgi:hypothetical protein